MGVTLIVCGVLWILFSFMVNTKDVKSALFGRVFPFVSGAIVAAIGLHITGIIHIAI